MVIGVPLLAGQMAMAASPGELLYLSQGDWERQPAASKIALAADFMRIFCTDQTMSPIALAGCLDKDRADGAMFERAIACVGAISSGR
ncbi:hypothetical protein NLM27_40385 [Bradyrhizobium sp. CCGB12]|uniref:hypothetical protein n=1 Tax=Bradyrhizobium sp. CCGB12 TaxID=2949632 RepID=UPI0020B3682A|nr:hypothetical protein [Bradyrhizobium sp. CCGB12]MCP3395010.1 hypothetical protein [Bradyrhizobium sp. CCGB12]